jgi:hypothetical protein
MCCRLPTLEKNTKTYAPLVMSRGRCIVCLMGASVNRGACRWGCATALFALESDL